MDTVIVAAEHPVALAPHEVFALFGTARGAGWLFDAHCDEVRPGAVVGLRLPLDGNDGHAVDVLGTISPGWSPPPRSTSSTPDRGAGG